MVDCTVTFVYQFCDDECFNSQLVLDEPVGTGMMQTLFAIGMCVCSWYWMGYNTKCIVIREAVCLKCSIAAECMDLWHKLYEQIALEYAYVNKTPLNLADFQLEEAYPEEALTRFSVNHKRPPPKARYSALIPMGGEQKGG